MRKSGLTGDEAYILSKHGGTTGDLGPLKKEISLIKENISNKITKFYASNQGETHLADSDNGKIMDMMLYGKSEQKQYSGKNLLKIKDGTQTLRGITVTAKDGVVELKGTATESGWVVLNIDSFVLDGMYILSSNITADIRVIVANKSFKTVLEQDKSATLENAEVSRVCFIVTEGKTYDISNILVQIEKGSVATSYEPYTGGIPSPNPSYPQEIKSVVNPTVKVCGKNLLQPNIKSNDRVKINIKKGTRLTLICKNGVVSQGGNLRFETANGGVEWFSFDAGAVKQQTVLRNNVVSFQYLLHYEPSESYALYIGDENTYEPYKEQSVQLPYTLNAIPVSSGGNVTINGQQYVADYVDVERGKIAKMVDSSKLDNAQSIVNKTEWLLAEPQEIDLTQEEVQTLKALATYYPTTNISVNSEQLEGYTVFNYPISMANGWNYVKQQLNDNRDYIYDMDTKTQDIDTQAAEAYVNSEYAVALTELEV